MRHIFIINPAAGKYDISVKVRSEIESVCAKHKIEPLIFISEYKYYEREMAEKMCALFSNEVIRFYSVGGSGTLTNIISGIKNFETTEVACCPYGLTNDILKSYSNVSDFRSIENLIEGKTDFIDTIYTNGTEGLLFTSLGLGTKYWNDISFYQVLSHINTLLPYWTNVIWDIITNKSFGYNISIDGKDYSGRYIMIIGFNGSCMGGNIRPIKSPRPNDGYMDVVLLGDMKLIDELRLLVPFSKGQLNKLGGYVHVIKAKKMKISRIEGGELSLNCDGECFTAKEKEISIELNAGKLKFIVPQTSFIFPPEIDA